MYAIKSTIAATAVAALSLSFTAAASTTSNPEHSYNAYADTTPAVASVADLRRGLKDFQLTGISADGRYRYAGPEAGYRLAMPARGMHVEMANNHLALDQSKGPMLTGSIGARYRETL